jgi:hypothetical protein
LQRGDPRLQLIERGQCTGELFVRVGRPLLGRSGALLCPAAPLALGVGPLPLPSELVLQDRIGAA